MSIRLDPRRLTSLKSLAGEAGIRPGELVLRWVEERIDTLRRGERGPAPLSAPAGDLGELRGLIEALAARVAALEVRRTEAATPAPEAAAPEAAAPVRRRPGRPRKVERVARPQRNGKGRSRVALHDEIIAVIGERGPLTAAEVAAAIGERGRYAPPRSGRALDAATVNSRVSNPTYRRLFRRQDGRIGLAEAATPEAETPEAAPPDA